MKKQAQRQDPLAWDRTNSGQPSPPLRGAGSMLAFLRMRICQTAGAATVMPSPGVPAGRCRARATIRRAACRFPGSYGSGTRPG